MTTELTPLMLTMLAEQQHQQLETHGAQLMRHDQVLLAHGEHLQELMDRQAEVLALLKSRNETVDQMLNITKNLVEMVMNKRIHADGADQLISSIDELLRTGEQPPRNESS
ncbi:MAG: hypothetical protein QM655_12645 [Nocardioidaceae bacterium]